MKIRDRIKELRRVKASELLPNPANWRTHPQSQQDALRGVLAEVGIADALLVRETPHGLQLLDGHLRADTSPDMKWPCLILDVNDEEAAKLLATFDPLAAMAEADPIKLEELLNEVETESEALLAMLTELRESVATDESEPEERPEQNPVISYNLVFDDEDQQQVWFRFLRGLKAQWPDTETHGARITAYLEEHPVAGDQDEEG